MLCVSLSKKFRFYWKYKGKLGIIDIDLSSYDKNR